MSRGFDLTPDLLTAQGRALRGLARSLLGDAHAAEDVVQETWLACLKHPGEFPERVSAWLGTVTKHLALHRIRGDGRREVRERVAAAPERLEALQQRSLEREEALRAVTQALLALEEPLKTVLLLRYYEDRAPGEIAAELGVPLATIKSRLARGLERLRAKLGAEFDGDEVRRTRALFALAGLHAPSALIAGSVAGAKVATVGTLALATKLQAAVAALVLAGGTLWWWNRAQEKRQELASAAPWTRAIAAAAQLAESGSESRTLAGPADGAERAAGAQRESVAAEKPALEDETAFSPDASYFYRITGQVRDELDLPLANARVFLGPHGFPLNHMGSTDDAGRFALEFAGRRPSFDCVFTVDDGGGRMLGLRELHLVSGQELVVDVGLGPISSSGRALVDLREAEHRRASHERGEPAPTVIRHGFEGAHEELVLRVGSNLLHYAGHGSEPLARAPAAARGSDGRLLFVDPPPTGACSRSFAHAELESVLRLVYEPAPGDVYRVAFVLEGGLLGSDRQAGDSEPAANGTIRGVVRDALGNPVSGAELRWAPPGGAFEKRASSDESGAFELLEVTAGEVVVRAGGGDQGCARATVTLAADQDLIWNPVLERGDEVTGRVVLLDEENTLSGVLVELWSASPTSLWCDATLTDADGRFALPNVPPGALELHVYASGVMNPPSAFPIRSVTPVFAPCDLGDIVLGVRDLVTSSLALSVLDAQGDPQPGAEVRVWQVASGRGCFASEPDETGSLVLAGLPHGSYRVEAGGPLGWRELGTIWVDEDVELAPVRFATIGFARFDVVPPVSAGESALPFSLWSVHPDVFGRVDTRELHGASLGLRAGEYILCAAGAKERRSETTLEVQPGGMSALTLDMDSASVIIAPPRALEASTHEASCSACHVSALGGG